jgi:hypothetical protein
MAFEREINTTVHLSSCAAQEQMPFFAKMSDITKAGSAGKPCRRTATDELSGRF